MKGIPAIRASARNALQLDPSLSEASAILGAVAGLYDDDWREAERQLDIAGARESVSSAVHILYGYFYLLLRGRPQDAAAELRRGLRDDPLNAALHVTLSECLFMMGHRSEALEHLNEAVELEHEHSVWAVTLLAIDHYSHGLNAEAFAWAKRALSSADWNPMIIGLSAGFLVRNGEPIRATKVMEMLREGHSYGASIGQAAFHLVVGDIDKAACWLEKNLGGEVLPCRRDPSST